MVLPHFVFLFPTWIGSGVYLSKYPRRCTARIIYSPRLPSHLLNGCTSVACMETHPIAILLAGFRDFLQETPRSLGSNTSARVISFSYPLSCLTTHPTSISMMFLSSKLSCPRFWGHWPIILISEGSCFLRVWEQSSSTYNHSPIPTSPCAPSRGSS